MTIEEESQSVYIFYLVTLAFVVLKLAGYIDWSWWWVWSPILIPFGVAAFVYFLMWLVNVAIGIERALWEDSKDKYVVIDPVFGQKPQTVSDLRDSLPQLWLLWTQVTNALLFAIADYAPYNMLVWWKKKK